MKINHNGSDLLKTQPIVISTVMMLILSVLAFIASIMGLLKQEIYNEVLLAGTITKSLVFGSIVQDIISVPASLLLMILSIFFFRKRSYKIFIDLCIVFPAFAIIVVKLFKENSFGNVLAGIALIKTFTLCISVALGELLKPINGFTQDISMIIIFIALTVISAILSVIYFTKLKIIVES